jgi:diguanylate cyclase (GGDEF)-like protein
MTMTGYYDLDLVLLSLAVAVVASYTALDLAGRVSAARGRAQAVWLLSGACSLGAGIWAMHFIGMLAFRLPIEMAYDLRLTLGSLLIAIVSSGLALAIIRRPVLGSGTLATGATLMGIGISGMHYTGMLAMQMSPPIRYDPLLFVASVLIAIIASLAALWIAFQLRRAYSRLAILQKFASAVVMGLAITGMHYTGMAAAAFPAGAVCLAVGADLGLEQTTLALAVGIATMGVLIITLVISALDAHFAAHNGRLASELRLANEALRDIALFDRLTGLPNRVLLDDRMNLALAHAQRTGTPFALMFIDLDAFKPINDTYGHAAGDELLLAVGKRLQKGVRSTDTVARTGGDEFVIVVDAMTSIDDASATSERVLAQMARAFVISGHELNVSCSIGVSVYPRDGEDLETLMRNADTAMYEAKRTGRNLVCFFLPGMRPEASRVPAADSP